ncbi:MAG: flagellar motor switch protein FliN [Anaerolineales bacterium]|nr:flagellar motor switch protein FliN [Anaerolineales bacterium]
MSDEMKQAAPAPVQPEEAGMVPEGDPIGISEDDLSTLGDLSVLQEQDINVAGETGSQSAAELTPAAAPPASQDAPGNIMAADFQSLSPADSNGNSGRSSIDMLMDVPLKVTVELGRTRMIVREVLDLQSGSVVELDRMAGEVVDILINERLIAKGEVVVVDDKFGVRITEMMGSYNKGNGLT